MHTTDNVGLLVDEYRTELHGFEISDLECLTRALHDSCEWTPKASEHLVYLAKNYGAFMLRNALALAIALEIEDGDMAF